MVVDALALGARFKRAVARDAEGKTAWTETLGKASCRGNIHRAEPDDDINYTVLALLLLEQNGMDFDTASRFGCNPAGQ